MLNLTVSAPRGLYLVRANENGPVIRGELVTLAVPPAFTSLVYGRGWLKTGTPLLKTVGGLPGEVLCVSGGRFSLSNQDLGPVFARDSQGMPLPMLSGCSKVPPGQFVPVSTFHPKSFDGRYMGAVPLALVTGRASLLWAF